jgi:ABC-type Mn2+/Zn2+ transport system ATPase subunit
MLVEARDRDGVTVLMISHDLAHVRRYADRVTVLDRRVITDGAPADVLS